MRSFEEDLSRAITFHGHLCGGQITGVRMARYALKYFGIEDPDHCLLYTSDAADE